MKNYGLVALFVLFFCALSYAELPRGAAPGQDPAPTRGRVTDVSDWSYGERVVRLRRLDGIVLANESIFLTICNGETASAACPNFTAEIKPGAIFELKGSGIYLSRSKTFLFRHLESFEARGPQPLLLVQPQVVNFGQVPVGSRKEIEVTIKNVGFNLSNFGIGFDAWGFGSYFDRPIVNPIVSNNCQQMNFPHGSTCTMTLGFAPTRKGGYQEDQVEWWYEGMLRYDDHPKNRLYLFGEGI